MRFTAKHIDKLHELSLGRDMPYDLRAALEENQHEAVAAEISRVLLTLEGRRDWEAEWHWIVRTTDGEHLYITGGCDYTGWD